MSTCSFPNYFITEILKPKHRIQNDLQIMAGGRVAVQVQAAGGLEHAVHLDQAGSHHHQVGQHLVLTDDAAQGGDHVIHGAGVGSDEITIGLLSGLAPVPGVVKGGDLGVGGDAGFILEEDVVGAVGVEGRVEVDEVDRFGGDVSGGWGGCRRSRGCWSWG